MGWASICIIAFGTVFLVGGIGMGIGASVRAGHRTAMATGTVVGFDERSTVDVNGSVSTSSYPIVDFVDADGTARHATQGFSGPHRHGIGDTVQISYEPGNAEGNFIIAGDDKDARILSLIFIGIGTVIVILGLCLPMFETWGM